MERPGPRGEATNPGKDRGVRGFAPGNACHREEAWCLYRCFPSHLTTKSALEASGPEANAAKLVSPIRRRAPPQDRNSRLVMPGRPRRSPRRRAPKRRKRKSSPLKSVSLALDLFLSKSPAPEK